MIAKFNAVILHFWVGLRALTNIAGQGSKNCKRKRPSRL